MCLKIQFVPLGTDSLFSYKKKEKRLVHAVEIRVHHIEAFCEGERRILDCYTRWYMQKALGLQGFAECHIVGYMSQICQTGNSPT